MRTRIKYLAVAVISVTVFVSIWHTRPRSRLDPIHDRFKLVSLTMTRAEVLDIMQGEPIVKVDGQMLFWPGVDGMGIVTTDPETGRATQVEWQHHNQCRRPIWMRLGWRMTTALGI